MTKYTHYLTFLFFIGIVRAQPTLTTSQSWGYGFLVGFGVSLMGFIAAFALICFQKCMNEACFKNFINMLYALSCGALLGDSAIHILPGAYTNNSTNTNLVSLLFICSIAFFIFLERIFQACGIAHRHWGDDQSHSHVTQQEHKHEHKSQQKIQIIRNQPCQLNNKGQTQTQFIKDGSAIENKVDESNPKIVSHISNSIFQNAQEENVQNSKNSSQEDNSGKGSWQNLKGKGTAGYLNLFSSFIHNIFDGLSLGVAFASRDKSVFVPMVIAIVAHQIPREMGDVGILFKSGFSNIQTVLCNGFINFFSLIGVLIGLGIGSMNEASQNYVMTFVAGNFIYIAADIWKNLLKNKNKAMNALQFFFLGIGVGLMFVVLLAESA